MSETAIPAVRVAQVLNEAGARYVIVGATAMQFWGTSRSTRDVDILIEPTLENAEAVLSGLAGLGFGAAAHLVASEVANRPVTMVGDVPNVDILTRAWNLSYGQAAAGVTIHVVDGVSIPVASIDDLIVSKQTGRLQDQADIEVLEELKRLRATP